MNKAAAASVEAATATGELTASTRVASRTSPAYTPTSSPVTIARPVPAEIRSISYNRYLKIATPMPAGRAAMPITSTSPAPRTPCDRAPAAIAARNEMRAAAPPAISQLSC